MSPREALTSSPTENVSLTEGFLPMPQIINEAIAVDPHLKPVLFEMAALDPTTFLHQVMVAECYTLLRTEYINRIAITNPTSTIKRLSIYLRSYDFPTLLHDFGKWLIKPSPHEATAIVNSKPPDEHVVLFGGNQDHRADDEIRSHNMHPLIGALTIKNLADMTTVPKSTWIQTIDANSGHHEHFSRIQVIDPDGRVTRSYPRKTLRPENSHHKIYHLLIMMADTLVAMGQPRAYRDFSQPDHKIMHTLDNIFDNFFESEDKRPPYKIFIARRALLTMAMNAIEAIREKYPPDVCRQLKGFLKESGEPIEKEFYEAYVLSELAKKVWDRHVRRLEKTL